MATNRKPAKTHKPVKKGKKARSKFAEYRFEVRLSGSGGQGLITAGVILAEAIAVGDAKNAALTQSYGPEARGGKTRCDVIISGGEIYFPEATELDILLALTQESTDSYMPLLKDCGLLIIDGDAVKHKPQRNYIAASFTKSAIKKLGSAVATNVVGLGFISEYTGIVSKKSLQKAVLSRFPERFAENNKAALKLGFELAKKLKAGDVSAVCDDTLETEIDRI